MTLLSELTGYLNAPAGLNTPGATSAQFISAEQNLGVLTWTGTTAPSGTISKLYVWYMIGPEITVYWKIKATVPGLLISQISTPLPPDCPTPKTFASQVNDSWAYVGDGAILSSATSVNNAGSACGLYKDSSGIFQLRINSGSATLSANIAMASCSYLQA